MPLYEYACEACGHRFERIQKFSDPLVEDCPNCGQKKVHKLVSSPAFTFKGSGFYVNDYARQPATDQNAEGHKPAADAKPGTDAKAPGKEETKTAPAPAATAASTSSKDTSSKNSSPKGD